MILGNTNFNRENGPNPCACGGNRTRDLGTRSANHDSAHQVDLFYTQIKRRIKAKEGKFWRELLHFCRAVSCNSSLSRTWSLIHIAQHCYIDIVNSLPRCCTNIGYSLLTCSIFEQIVFIHSQNIVFKYGQWSEFNLPCTFWFNFVTCFFTALKTTPNYIEWYLNYSYVMLATFGRQFKFLDQEWEVSA